MRIDLSSNITEVLGWTARLHPQFEFAAAVALTKSMVDAQRAVVAEERAKFDRPTPYALKATFVRKATKRSLYAELAVKDFQFSKGPSPTETIGHQFLGGERRRKAIERYAERAGLIGAREYLVPASGARLDEYGNMSKGQVAQVMSQLRLGLDPASWKTKSSASKRSQKRAGHIFWSRGENFHRGIWMFQGTKLNPIMLAVSTARYEQLIDLSGIANTTASVHFDEHLEREFANAIATQRK